MGRECCVEREGGNVGKVGRLCWGFVGVYIAGCLGEEPGDGKVFMVQGEREGRMDRDLAWSLGFAGGGGTG